VGVHCRSRRRFKPRDRQTDRQTDTANIGKHSLHSMQPKTNETQKRMSVPFGALAADATVSIHANKCTRARTNTISTKG